MRHASVLPCVLAITVFAACSESPDERHPTAPSVDALPPTASVSVLGSIRDRLARTPFSGGVFTIFDASPDAFETIAPHLTAAEVDLHEEGDEAFDATFVPAPATVNAGLGPVFDNVSCTGCHLGDGRGRPPLPGEIFESMLFRSSIPGAGPHGGPNPVPGFGGQLQLRAIPGMAPGLVASITYVDSGGRFADGTPFSLRVPQYQFANGYAPIPANLLFSPRTAPFVFGLGLLEAVPEILIRASADPSDRDSDGISGRVNSVWDVTRGQMALGRFGWKAGAPNLRQQTAGAYNGDMGVTSSMFPAEPCEGYRPGCDRHAPEVSDAVVEATAFYQRTLAVPARRNLNDAAALAGEDVFYDAGCARCHTSTLVTGRVEGVRAFTAGLIHPYTDLLLHDMGPGLADNRPDFAASGSEWRTPPLWGIGLVQTVNGHTNFLHDGRARSLMEAILWHGGEARPARDAVLRLPASARAALVAFLESL
jgi:CxxC motif-containing protein (DUF1111 family)